jgi:hypothetical protein
MAVRTHDLAFGNLFKKPFNASCVNELRDEGFLVFQAVEVHRFNWIVLAAVSTRY